MGHSQIQNTRMKSQQSINNLPSDCIHKYTCFYTYLNSHTHRHIQRILIYTKIQHLHKPEIFMNNELKCNIHGHKNGIMQNYNNQSKLSLL